MRIWQSDRSVKTISWCDSDSKFLLPVQVTGLCATCHIYSLLSWPLPSHYHVSQISTMTIVRLWSLIYDDGRGWSVWACTLSMAGVWLLDNCAVCCLQSVTNSATRLVFSLSRYDHITLLLRQLHGLKAPEQIDYKLAVLVFKCLHGVAPS